MNKKNITWIGAILTFILLTLSAFPLTLSFFYLIAPTDSLAIFLIMPLTGLILTSILYLVLTKNIEKNKVYVLSIILHLIPVMFAYLFSIPPISKFYYYNYWIAFFSMLIVPILILSGIINFIIIKKVKK